jgi:membrane protease YdiL (CAAX protease family)
VRNDPRARAAREALVASVGVLVVLGALKHLAPLLGDHVFTVAVALQLYVPLWRAGDGGREALGLHLDAWRRDLGAVAVLAVLTTVPFALAHHVWQTQLLGRPFSPRLPDDLLENLLVQVGVIALAEEVFFRGYLQARLEQLWPARRAVLGVPFGRAVLVASGVFALAHFVGEYRLDRLGPFFPGLVFGWLRARTGTVVGAIGYHAFCNVLGDFLFASYRGR